MRDSFLRQVMQTCVGGQNPKNAWGLRTAIARAPKPLSQGEITRAIRQFARRLETRIKAGGGRFDRRKQSPGGISAPASGPCEVELYEGSLAFADGERDRC